MSVTNGVVKWEDNNKPCPQLDRWLDKCFMQHFPFLPPVGQPTRLQPTSGGGKHAGNVLTCTHKACRYSRHACSDLRVVLTQRGGWFGWIRISRSWGVCTTSIFFFFFPVPHPLRLLSRASPSATCRQLRDVGCLPPLVDPCLPGVMFGHHNKPFECLDDRGVHARFLGRETRRRRYWRWASSQGPRTCCNKTKHHAHGLYW